MAERVDQFGQQLRQEREARGIELAAISNSTKIAPRYLLALENNDFSVLPGGILSKGMVRGYARVVGLDESLWIQRFLAATHQDTTATPENDWTEFAENISRARAHERPRPTWSRRMGSAALLLLALAGVAWFAWRYVVNRTVAAQTSQQPVASAAVTGPAGGDSGQ